MVSQKSHKSAKSLRSCKSSKSQKIRKTTKKEKRKQKKRTDSFNSEEIFERLHNPPKSKKANEIKDNKKTSEDKAINGKRVKEQRQR
jgi:hypothetical protein